jgi:ribosomal protein L37E
MAFCDRCGKPVYRLDRTCANCGAPVAQVEQPAYGNSNSRSRMNDDYSMGSAYDVLSSWGFVGSILLMSIPVIGFIIMIVWASGGASNLNRRNLARAYLIFLGISFLLSIVLAFVLIASGISLDQYYNRFY